MSLIIAIDGPAGSGKSTTARLLADRLHFRYLDTGAMYRAATLAFQRAGVAPGNEDAARVIRDLRIDLAYEEGRIRVALGGEDVTDTIRHPAVSAEVSRIAADPAVRAHLVEEQRRLAQAFLRQGVGVVLDGRDIGTHVFPDAHIKVYLVADPGVRAERRVHELRAMGIEVTPEEVLRDLVRRDEIDSTRSVAPLRKASDAIELDTTRLTVDQQVDFVVDLVRERRNSASV